MRASSRSSAWRGDMPSIPPRHFSRATSAAAAPDAAACTRRARFDRIDAGARAFDVSAETISQRLSAHRRNFRRRARSARKTRAAPSRETQMTELSDGFWSPMSTGNSRANNRFSRCSRTSFARRLRPSFSRFLCSKSRRNFHHPCGRRSRRFGGTSGSKRA